MSVEQTLAERGQRYGDFADHAAIAQAIQDSIRLTRPNGWERLNDMQRQALTVIADKIARILSGDPNYVDNWHDIQGYAKLVEDRLPTEQPSSACPYCHSAEGSLHHPDCHLMRRGKSVLAQAADAFETVSLHAAVGVALEEPAAQIDDESDRQKAVEQNGNDGAVYDDPWYGAPEWARFKAQDEDGQWWYFSSRPVTTKDTWVQGDDIDVADNFQFDRHAEPNPNWRDTLIERTSGQDPQE